MSRTNKNGCHHRTMRGFLEILSSDTRDIASVTLRVGMTRIRGEQLVAETEGAEQKLWTRANI